MKIYLAYKYKQIKDKPTHEKTLLAIADKITVLNNKVFLLGRDVQKWGSVELTHTGLLSTIMKNIKKSDTLFAYINSNVFSFGLAFEFVWATIFGKKIIVAVEDGVKAPLFSALAAKKISFKDSKDLIEKLPEFL